MFVCVQVLIELVEDQFFKDSRKQRESRYRCLPKSAGEMVWTSGYVVPAKETVRAYIVDLMGLIQTLTSVDSSRNL